LGHPFSDEDYELPFHYIPDGPILLLLGSRKAHIHKISPIMLDIIKQLRKFGEMREIVVVYPDDDILEILQNINQKYENISIVFVRSGAKKIPAGAALMSSGTIALNCALAGVPSVVIYRANIFTYGLAKILVKITFLHIENILLNRKSSREFLQFSAKPKLICHAVRDCLNDPEIRLCAQKDGEELRQIFSADAQNDAVSWVQNALL
jgi:lipid-A-disaccharide synthase